MIDFLIIGGGIAGISTAARLSKLGTVVVLEAEPDLGFHSSGRSAAMFEESYGSATTLALNKASRNFLANSDGGVLSSRGLMLIGTARTTTSFALDMKSMMLRPMPLKTVLGFVPVLNGSVVTEVGYNADAADIDTDLLLQNFARTTRKSGGQILTGRKVKKIQRNRNAWNVVTTDREIFSATPLLNAAGAWVDEVARTICLKRFGFYLKHRIVFCHRGRDCNAMAFGGKKRFKSNAKRFRTKTLLRSGVCIQSADMNSALV